MRNLLSKYRHLASLVMVILFAVGLANLNLIQPVTAFFIVACWQLVAFAQSPQVGACFVAALTEAQLIEFSRLMKEVDDGWREIKGIPDRVKGLEKENDELRGQLKSLRKIGLRGLGDGVRWAGNKAFVSEIGRASCRE